MLEVTDYYELIALNKALHAARYQENPGFSEVPGSPFVAAIHERVLTAIFGHDNTPQTQIDEWLTWKNRRIEQDCVRKHLINCNWRRMDAATQREFVCILVKPFVATDSEIDELIAYAEEYHSEKAQ